MELCNCSLSTKKSSKGRTEGGVLEVLYQARAATGTLVKKSTRVTKTSILQRLKSFRSGGTAVVYTKYILVRETRPLLWLSSYELLHLASIAVRVAGKPPQPTVPPGPASTMPTYPVSSQPMGAYPSQQFTPGGPLPNVPPGGYPSPPPSYGGTPVPWGPPVPPPYGTCAPPPPPPGSTVYPPVPGQAMPTYGLQYPSPGQPVPSGVPTQTVASSKAQQSYPPGVQTANSSSAPPPSSNFYGNSMSAYATAPLGYLSYYNAVPPPPAPVSAVDHSQGMSNVPWASNPPPPAPASSASEKTTYGADAEYEKFMAEMK